MRALVLICVFFVGCTIETKTGKEMELALECIKQGGSFVKIDHWNGTEYDCIKERK